MYFEIVGEVERIETIAVGGRIKDIMRLRRKFGPKSMRRKRADRGFVLCVKNDDCDDLERRKVYRVISDEKAEKDGYVRVIDESGEDYIYPSSYFVRLQPPQEAEQAISAAG